MSEKKQKQQSVFWFILNQEESVVGLSYAKTKGGALEVFERASGLDRISYRAEQVQFDHASCALAPGLFNI